MNEFKKEEENKLIISFVNPKGGNGKSTATICTAFSKPFLQKYNKLAVIEFDSQGTVKNWFTERENNQNKTDKKVKFYQILGKNFDDMSQKIEEIREEYDVLILDTPGESLAKDVTQFALAISDIVISPMRTSMNDEHSFEENLLPMLKHIFEKQQIKKFFVLPVFVSPQAKSENIYKYFSSILPDYIQCLQSVFRVRSVFENFSRDGLTLQEYAKTVKNNKKDLKQAQNAIENINTIADDIINVKI
jgi:cellulose biosynthesis protein BcsQ